MQTVINSISSVSVFANGATGLLDTASLTAMTTAVSGLSKEQALLVLSTKSLTNAQKEQVLASAGIIATDNKISASLLAQSLSKSKLTIENQKQILSSLELTDAQTHELISGSSCTKEALLNTLAKEGVAKANRDEILSSLGLTGSNGKQAVSWNLLTASIWANIKALGKWLITNPVGWAIIGGTAILGLSKAFDKHSESVKKSMDESTELSNAWKSENESIDSLISKYNELNNKLKSNGTTTDEIKSIKQELLSVQDELTDKYGTEAMQLDLVNGKYDEQISKIRKLQKEKASDYLATNYSNIKNDKKYVEDNFYNASNGLGFSSSMVDTNLNDSGFDLGKYLEKYESLSAKVTEAATPNGMVGEVKLILNGTKGDIYNQLNNLFNELQSDFGENPPEGVKKFKSVISTIMTETLDKDAIDVATANITEYAKAKILSNDSMNSLYEEAKSISQEYLDAIDSGKGIEKAEKDLLSIEDQIYSQGFSSDVQSAFDEIIKSAIDKYNEQLSKVLDFNNSISSVARTVSNNTDGNVDAMNKKSEETYSKLNDYTKDFTLAQKERWTEVTSEAETADDAIKKYEESLINIPLDQFSSFDDVFNSTDFASTAKELKELSLAGTLAPEVLTSTDEYNTLLEQTGMTAEEVADKIHEIALSETSLADIMNTMKSHAELINTVNDNIADTGKIAVTTLQSIASTYPQLETYISDYLNGVEGAQDELVNQLGELYKADINNCKEYYRVKWSNDSSYWENFVENSLSAQVTELAKQYSLDLQNFKSYATAKAQIASELYNAQTLATNIETNQNSPYASLMGRLGYLEDDTITQKMNAEKTAAQKKASDLQKILSELKSGFNADLDFGTSGFNAENFSPESFKTSSDSSSSSSKSESKEEFDWVETKINNVSDALDKLKDKSSDTYSSWSDRNTALSQAMQKTQEAIALQSSAYDTYMAKANSVGSGLSDVYKNLVQNGAMDVSTITDSDLADKISDYQTWYEKAQDCLKTQDDLKNSLNELNQQKFDAIKKQYDDLNTRSEHSITIVQNTIDLLNMKGLYANESYYSNMASYTASQIANLTNQKTQLSNVLRNIDPGETWDSMYNEILSIDEEISSLSNDLVDFNNQARDLNWDIFEYLEESINRITDETSYLIDLMSNEDLYDADGNITEFGTATIGIHAVAYDTYRQQAKDYYEEVQELQNQLVNGAGKDVLEQYNDMVNAHRDAVTASVEEKNAILDLIEDGYNSQLDALNDLIDKRKDALNAEKDLYDYQKSIKEKTDKVSKLEKQKLAYSNDDSEDAMAKIQKIQVELADAKEDLKETEYEQYLRDTETMLDQLSEDYETWMNERMDNEDVLLSEIVSSVGENGSAINDTLNTVSEKYGTMISDSITSVFSSDSPFTTSLTTGLTSVSNSIAGTTSAINNLVNKVASITGTSASNTNAGTVSGGNTNTGTASSSSTASNANKTNTSSSATTSPDNSSGLIGGIFKSKTDSYPKSKLNKEQSVVDRLKFNNFDSSFSARAEYWSKIFGGTYTGSDSQNVKLLNYMKSNGYKKGTSFVPKSGYNWTQEGGQELILRPGDGGILTPLKRGDSVLTTAASQRLLDFANDPSSVVKMIPDIKTPDYSNLLSGAGNDNRNQSSSISFGDTHLTVAQANDTKDIINALIESDRFEKAMCAMMNNKMTGKGSSFDKLKYIKR